MKREGSNHYREVLGFTAQGAPNTAISIKTPTDPITLIREPNTNHYHFVLDEYGDGDRTFYPERTVGEMVVTQDGTYGWIEPLVEEAMNEHSMRVILALLGLKNVYTQPAKLCVAPDLSISLDIGDEMPSVILRQPQPV